LLLAAAACDTPGRYVVHSDALRGERYALPVTIDADLVVHADDDMARVSLDAIDALARDRRQLVVAGGAASSDSFASALIVVPSAARLDRVDAWRDLGVVSLATWEPAYGRLAEAQVKWEAAHHRPLSAG
jgi:tRNA threonylcarbamoyladenosine biosynthesis protein TsaB